MSWSLLVKAVHDKKFHDDSEIHYDDVIMTMLASQITSLTVVYSIVYSGVNQRKHQSSASQAFVREIHRGPVNFPHKWPVTRKMFPFDDVIMCVLLHQSEQNPTHEWKSCLRPEGMQRWVPQNNLILTLYGLVTYIHWSRSSLVHYDTKLFLASFQNVWMKFRCVSTNLSHNLWLIFFLTYSVINTFPDFHELTMKIPTHQHK